MRKQPSRTRVLDPHHSTRAPGGSVAALGGHEEGAVGAADVSLPAEHELWGGDKCRRCELSLASYRALLL